MLNDPGINRSVTVRAAVQASAGLDDQKQAFETPITGPCPVRV